MAYIELMDKNKFSDEFKSKYGEEIEKNFLYNLPLRYTLSLTKLSLTETKFIKKVKDKLSSINYK